MASQQIGFLKGLLLACIKRAETQETSSRRIANPPEAAAKHHLWTGPTQRNTTSVCKRLQAGLRKVGNCTRTCAPLMASSFRCYNCEFPFLKDWQDMTRSFLPCRSRCKANISYRPRNRKWRGTRQTHVCTQTHRGRIRDEEWKILVPW